MSERPKKAKPVTKTEAPRERERIGVNLNVWLPEELMEAFEEQRSETRRTKTAEVMVMMEQYLKACGKWPRH